MDRWNEFFTLYNEELARVYDKELDSYGQDDQTGDPDFQEQLRNQVLNSMQSWYGRRFDQLGQSTPEEMIDAIGTAEEAIGRLKAAAVFCDDDIPEYLKIRLGSFGESSVSCLLQTAMEPSWEGDYSKEEAPSADILGAAVSLKILGEWQAFQTLDAVLPKFIHTATPQELIADAFKSYITGMGEIAIPPLRDALNAACRSGSTLEGPYEYMIIALTLVSQEHRSDDTFACLRSCFRTMKHKVIGAICIGDYGDPRGISVLKGYLDRNPGGFDRQEFYEILSSIKRLGGTTNDIHDPFRDFSVR